MADASNHGSTESSDRLVAPFVTMRRVVILAMLSIAGWFLFWPAETPAPPSGPHDLVLIASDRIERLSFSPDGRRLLMGMPVTAVIWDVQNGDVLRSFRDSDYSVMEIATFSPDGRSIVTKPANTALLFDAETGARLASFAGHERALQSAAFSPDSRRLITSSLDETVRIFDADRLQPPSTWFSSVETRSPTVTLGRRGNVENAIFSPDGKRVLILARLGGVAELIDTDSWQSIALLRAERGDMRQATFTPDGRRVLTLSASRVQTWSADDGRLLLDLRPGPASVFFQRAAVSPDSRRIATVGANARITLWDAETGRALTTTAAGDALLTGLSFSPDGRRFATTSTDGTVQLWDAETASALTRLPGAAERAANPVFSPDGHRLAASFSAKRGTFSDDVTRIWPLRDAAPYHDPALATVVRREHRALDEWIVARYRLARRRLGL